MTSFKPKGFIPHSLTSLIIITIVLIYLGVASCDPLGPPDSRSLADSQPVSSGSHSDSHSGPGSWSYSWSDPDPGANAPKSRQKRFCLLIFWLCTGGGGGGGSGGGGNGGSGGGWFGGAPGAPGGRV